MVDCHKSADRSPPVRRIPEDVEPDLEGDLSLVDRNAIALFMMAVDTDNGNAGYGNDLKIPLTNSKTVSKCWPLYQPDMTMVTEIAMIA